MASKGTSFQSLYGKLNAAQKQAVDAIEGPVMVVAGPGTGKTQILTLRIANILRETDTPPDGILALTFTESAVAAMRRRLVSIIGSPGYRVRIHTFHNFCNDIITRFPDEFPRIIGAEPISDIDRISLLRSIIGNGTFEHLKPLGDPYYYVNSLRQKIGELKRENMTPERLEELLQRDKAAFDAREDLYHEKGPHVGKMKGVYQTEAKKRERSFELLQVYKTYEQALRDQHKIDYEDMILEAVAALEQNEDLRLRVQEETLYLLADEHQDANAAQNKLLELLTSFHESPNIFVVGDEKQAIFRFQGASLDNFLYFKSLYPHALLVTLTEGYRSGQKILDAAHSLMMSEPGADPKLRVPLVSRAGVSHERVEVRSFIDRDIEYAWAAEYIGSLIGEGVEASEIAVLYRTNREADDIAHVFESRGLAVSIESDQNALSDPDIRTLILFLRAIAYFGSDEILLKALHAPFLRLPPLSLYKIIRTALREHVLIADVLRSKELLTNAGVEDVEMLTALYEKMAGWAASSDSVLQLLDAIIRDSGFLAYTLQSDRSVDLLEKLGGLVRDAESLATGRQDYSLQDLMAHFILLEEYAIPVRKIPRMIPRTGAVRLMTAHASKGLEFDYVFITGASDGAWGGRVSRESFAIPLGGATGSDDDERRLFYVALTRARQGVSISYARSSPSGKEQLPTRFLEEMDTHILERIDTKEIEERLRQEGLQRSIPLTRSGVLADDKQYLNELFLRQGLSVTALNQYLDCPWRFFYCSLVRIPSTPGVPALFGTAVHRALHRYFGLRKSGNAIDADAFLTLFDEELMRLPLSLREIESIQKAHRASLSLWFDARKDIWREDSFSEYEVSVHIPFEGMPFSDLLLRGDIDLLEFGSVEGHVDIIDFKTGKPKSRNAILGNTKSDAGDYSRQLVFYALLLQKEDRYIMDTAAIDFVEADEKGTIRPRELFTVSDDDRKELLATIARVAGEIYDLSFWEKSCDDLDCEFCALRDMLLAKR